MAETAHQWHEWHWMAVAIDQLLIEDVVNLKG